MKDTQEGGISSGFTLMPKQAFVLWKRRHSHSLRDIGDALGITRVRVSVIEQSAWRKIQRLASLIDSPLGSLALADPGAWHALARRGLNLEQVRHMSDEELLQVRGIGRKRLQQIRAALKE